MNLNSENQGVGKAFQIKDYFLLHVNEYGQEFWMQENCKLLLNMLPGRSLKEY